MAGHGEENSAFRHRAALGLIVLLALILRTWGIRYGLIDGLSFHPDEPTYVFRASRMTWHDLNPRYFINSSLYIYILFLQIQVAKLLGVVKFPQALGSDIPFLIGRMTSVVLGSATVLALYYSGKRLFSRRVGILAALFLSVTFMHCRDSHFAVNDITMTFLLALAFYFCIRYANSGKSVHSLGAGLLAGLAVSAKYSAGLVVTTVVVAHILVALSRRTSARRVAEDLLMSSLCMTVGFLLGTPYAVLDIDSFSMDFILSYDWKDKPVFGQARGPSWLMFHKALGIGMGWVLYALSLMGLVLLAKRDRRSFFLVGAFPLCYYAFMSGMKVFGARYILPMLPFMILLAAFSVGYLMDKAGSGLRGKVVTAALLLAAVGQPTYQTVLHDRLLTRKDTRVLAGEWIGENLPTGSFIAMDRRVLVDESSYKVLRAEHNLPKVELEYYKGLGVEFMVVSQHLYARYRRYPERFRKEVSFYDRLDTEATLIKTFYPSKDETEVPFRDPEIYAPYARLSSLERPGPTLKIYRF